ncbi:hypothetical protein METSCH_E01850 [Metschnikowia aff. pulcherrima]|uniref:Uncharacterized protein n=1 Tax=Metschnikowia aff. pulcherrima TaxID=2163413 RepID=A0A4P6XUQ4_9ASCO|nr:hypothetical protein METSCH_E01850 [Metschnikowia aff. pulcherrima]
MSASCPFHSRFRLAISYKHLFLELAALLDNNRLRESTAVRAHGLDFFNNVHTLSDLTENNVGAVQPWARHSGDEKLRPVGVGASVGHRQQAWLGVLLGKVLVGEFLAVDRLATSTVVSGEITTLQHELRDHSVETRLGVAKAFLAGAQGSEVFCSLGDNLVEQLELDRVLFHATNGRGNEHFGPEGSAGARKRSDGILEHRDNTETITFFSQVAIRNLVSLFPRILSPHMQCGPNRPRMKSIQHHVSMNTYGYLSSFRVRFEHIFLHCSSRHRGGSRSAICNLCSRLSHSPASPRVCLNLFNHSYSAESLSKFYFLSVI